MLLGGQLSQAGWEPLLTLDEKGHYNAGQGGSTFHVLRDVVPPFLRHNRCVTILCIASTG